MERIFEPQEAERIRKARELVDVLRQEESAVEHAPDTEIVELERNIRKATVFLSRVCEKRIQQPASEPSPESLALMSAVLTLQKEITVFLAVENRANNNFECSSLTTTSAKEKWE
ncbi:hypothetical protein LJC23_02845 [Desulfovibrio sp. OttesenSCG-928-I05]|nr:hypothetical protein [Desulfovibrio sp. OttesenSCG-928-I05]